MKFWLPWDLDMYKMLNGAHPLLLSYVNNCSDHEFLSIDRNNKLHKHDYNSLFHKLKSFYNSKRVGIETRAAWRFARKMNFLENQYVQKSLPKNAILFKHTAPHHISSHDFIFHFESFQSLFIPFSYTGKTRHLDISHNGYKEYLLKQLDTQQCLAIFSHIKSSVDIIKSVLGSRIEGKVFHVPLGITSIDIDEKIKLRANEPIRILFSNSFHGDPNSFYIRGGQYILHAIKKLRQDGANVTLTIVSKKPKEYQNLFFDENVDGINWIDEWISDHHMQEILRSSDIFACPSAGLHSFSLIKAIAYGCVPIVSNALGYEEFMRDKFIGGNITSIFDAVYRREPLGWISDNYGDYFDLSVEVTNSIMEKILFFCDRGNIIDAMKRNELTIQNHFSTEVQRISFNKMIARTC